MLIHDDDILYFELYEDGEKTDEYNSNPACFGDEEADESPSGGDASRLAAVFGGKDVGAVEAILRRSDYIIETRRHLELADALGLPRFAVGIGYRYAAEDAFPPGISKASFVRT